MTTIAEGAHVDEMNRHELGVDQLMQRVRAEVHSWSGDSSGAGAMVATRATESVSMPPPEIQLTLPDCPPPQFELAFKPSADGTYRLQELLEHHDRTFIHAAYWAVLKRAPDQGGLATYLRLLRTGTSKLEILEILRSSQEGVTAAARIAGLSLQLAIVKIQRWPLIGPLVRSVRTVFRAAQIERDQRVFQSQVLAAAEREALNVYQNQLATNAAIRELLSGFRQLTTFAASRLSPDDLGDLESALDFANESASQVRALIDKKADSAQVRSSLDGVSAGLRSSLDGVSADLRRALEAMAHTLQSLQTSKAERSELDEKIAALHEARALLFRAMEAKADRHELTALSNHFISMLEARLTAALRDTQAWMEDVAKSKADLSMLEAFQSASQSALAQAVNDIARELAMFSQNKADRHALEAFALRSSLDTLAVETKSLVADATNPLVERMSELSRSKVDSKALEIFAQQSTLDALARETSLQLAEALAHVNGRLTELAESKVDSSTLDRFALQTAVDALAHETSAKLAETLARVNGRLTELAESKVDSSTLDRFALQTAVDALAHETSAKLAETLAHMNGRLTELAESKVDSSTLDRFALQTAVDALAHETSAKLVETLARVNGRLTDLSASKADRDALENKSNAFEAALAAARSELHRTLATALVEVNSSLKSLKDGKVDSSAVAASERETKSLIETAVGDLARQVTAISASKADRVELETAQKAARELSDAALRESNKSLQNAVVSFNTHTRDIKRNVLDQERRLSLLLEEARKRLPQPIAKKQIEAMLTEEDHILDAMYASFEDIFRGSREDIKQRQSIYIPYIKTAGAGIAAAKVVDLGSGRGEWLENLRDANLEAVGADTNRIFLERCREMELNVVESDAIDFLRGLKPKSVGAVTSFHLIEHLPHRALLSLLDAAFQALRPGGLIILETPNPRNVLVGSCNFYMDPTHRQPLPPDLMRYLAEARGFVQIEVKELHPFPAESQVSEGAPMVNDVLNRFFFSCQDYAIIARKP